MTDGYNDDMYLTVTYLCVPFLPPQTLVEEVHHVIENWGTGEDGEVFHQFLKRDC